MTARRSRHREFCSWLSSELGRVIPDAAFGAAVRDRLDGLPPLADAADADRVALCYDLRVALLFGCVNWPRVRGLLRSMERETQGRVAALSR